MTTSSSVRTRQPQLVAPAGSLTALRAALEHGADAVYLGLRDATNARNFGGLNFTEADIRTGVAEAMRAMRRCCSRSTPFRRWEK